MNFLPFLLLNNEKKKERKLYKQSNYSIQYRTSFLLQLHSWSDLSSCGKLWLVALVKTNRSRIKIALRNYLIHKPTICQIYHYLIQTSPYNTGQFFDVMWLHEKPFICGKLNLKACCFRLRHSSVSPDLARIHVTNFSVRTPIDCNTILIRKFSIEKSYNF